MFKYTLPCGGFRTTTRLDEKRGMVFCPPVYEQRYVATMQILEDERWSKHMTKIIDFGCGPMRFLPLLRRVPTVRHLLEIDIDRDLLEKYKYKADPLICDYVNQRKVPLKVDVLHGSIAEPSKELENIDAIVALETIEHVDEDVLSKIPGNIFGFIKPKLVILSTPNQDYNVLFNLDKNSFRHHDHKFEWTRKQFQNWCKNITATYTNYKVSFMGVGAPTVGNEKVGFASQMAIFARNDIIGLPMVVDEPMETSTTDIQSTYNLIHSIDYPYFVDERTKQQKILDELEFVLQKFTGDDSGYLDEENDSFKIPIKDVLRYTLPLDGTESVVRELLPSIDYVTVKDDSLLIANNKYGEDLYSTFIEIDPYADDDDADGDCGMPDIAKISLAENDDGMANEEMWD